MIISRFLTVGMSEIAVSELFNGIAISILSENKVLIFSP